MNLNRLNKLNSVCMVSGSMVSVLFSFLLRLVKYVQKFEIHNDRFKLSIAGIMIWFYLFGNLSVIVVCW